MKKGIRIYIHRYRQYTQLVLAGRYTAAHQGVSQREQGS